ncbi:MAG: RNA polymerase sigma factor [bacterium]
MDSLSDAQLAEELKLASSEAFQELYGRYKQQIFYFCLKLTNNQAQAEDAAHDTFLKMFGNINTLTNTDSFKPWLYTIARNQVYNLFARKQTDGLNGKAEPWDPETPLHLLEEQEQTEAIALCLNALKPEYKEVLFLQAYEGLSYTEIAVATGATESSVKSRLFKARKALAEKLKHYF